MKQLLFIFLFFLPVIVGCRTYIVSYDEEHSLPTHLLQTAYFQGDSLFLGTLNHFVHYEKVAGSWQLKKAFPVVGCHSIKKGMEKDSIWLGTDKGLFQYHQGKIKELQETNWPILEIVVVANKRFLLLSKTAFEVKQKKDKYEFEELQGFSGKPVAILSQENREYLITETSIYQLEGHAARLLYEVSTGQRKEIFINCVAFKNDIFWIGTDHGLFSITTNFLQLKSWGLKSRILGIAYINSTIFCSTYDSLFRYTLVGFWEKFPLAEFSPPKNIINPYHMLYFIQKEPQTIDFISANHGLVRLSYKNYNYRFEFLRPKIPNMKGSFFGKVENTLYSQYGAFDISSTVFQENPWEEELLGVFYFEKKLLFITQKGIWDPDSRQKKYLWKVPIRSFTEEFFQSGSLFTIILSGFPRKATHYLFEWEKGKLHLRCKGKFGALIGANQTSSQKGYLITEENLIRYRRKRRKQKLKSYDLPIETPFFSTLNANGHFYLATSKGIFGIEKHFKVKRFQQFKAGNLRVRFLAEGKHFWCISSAGEIFKLQKGHWKLKGLHQPPKSGVVSIFAQSGKLYFHNAGTSILWFYERKEAQQIYLPLRCSQINFLSEEEGEIFLDSPEAFISRTQGIWNLLQLRETTFLDGRSSLLLK